MYTFLRDHLCYLNKNWQEKEWVLEVNVVITLKS